MIDKIRKSLSLTLAFMRGCVFHIIAVLLICALALGMITLFAAKYDYYYSGYDTIENAELDDGIYFSYVAKSQTQYKLFDEIKAQLEAVDGVESVIYRPIILNYRFEEEYEYMNGDGECDIYSRAIYLYTEEMYEAFPITLTRGRGFDYSSDEIEIIVATNDIVDYTLEDGTEINVPSLRLGSSVDLYLAAKLDDNVLSAKITGIGRYPQAFPTMTGSSSNADADTAIDFGEAIIMKYNDAAVVALEAYMKKTNAHRHLTNAFVSFSDDLTDEELKTAQANVARLGLNTPVEQMLVNSKEKVQEVISEDLPMSLYLSGFAMVTLVCLITLSLYRQAKTSAIWFRVGCDRRKIFLIPAASFCLTITAAAVAARIAAQYIIEKDPEAYYDVLLGTRATAALVLCALLLIAVSVAASALIVRKTDPRDMADDYTE